MFNNIGIKAVNAMGLWGNRLMKNEFVALL